jgi:hypothetical protein
MVLNLMSATCGIEAERVVGITGRALLILKGPNEPAQALLALKGRNKPAQGNALGRRRERHLAPKGRNKPAQGNALGRERHHARTGALKGRNKRRCRPLLRPFRVAWDWGAPWPQGVTLGLWCPFGAGSARPVTPNCCALSGRCGRVAVLHPGRCPRGQGLLGGAVCCALSGRPLPRCVVFPRAVPWAGLLCPFRANNASLPRPPRALPWAGLLRPFRVRATLGPGAPRGFALGWFVTPLGQPRRRDGQGREAAGIRGTSCSTGDNLQENQRCEPSGGNGWPG